MSDDPILLAVKAELEIRNLLAKLAQLSDEGDLEDYIKLFSDDVVWEGGAALGSMNGPDEILEAAAARRKAGVSGPGTNTRHAVTTSVVEVDGDFAEARSVVHYHVNTDATPTLVLLGVYEDRFERTGRGWLLSRRKIVGGRIPATAS